MLNSGSNPENRFCRVKVQWDNYLLYPGSKSFEIYLWGILHEIDLETHRKKNHRKMVINPGLRGECVEHHLPRRQSRGTASRGWKSRGSTGKMNEMPRLNQLNPMVLLENNAFSLENPHDLAGTPQVLDWNVHFDSKIQCVYVPSGKLRDVL